MTIKEQLLKEIDNSPHEVLETLLSFLHLIQTDSITLPYNTRQLLERIDYLETVVGIRQGLDEFEQGQGIPAEQGLETLQNKFKIPPRA